MARESDELPQKSVVLVLDQTCIRRGLVAGPWVCFGRARGSEKLPQNLRDGGQAPKFKNTVMPFLRI